jgi:hypothetical protein
MDVCLLDIGALEFFDILTIIYFHNSSVSKSERIPLFDGPDLIGTLGTCIPAILTTAATKIKYIQARFISYLLSTFKQYTCHSICCDRQDDDHPSRVCGNNDIIDWYGDFTRLSALQ